MEVTLYCHQISSGSDEDMWFTDSFDQCQADALEHHAQLLKDYPGRNGALAIYEIVLRVPDAPVMIAILNEASGLLEKCLVSKKLVALVAGEAP